MNKRMCIYIYGADLTARRVARLPAIHIYIYIHNLFL